MQRPAGGLRIAPSDQSQQLLAMVEAEIGSLLEVLPVPLLVTSGDGDILRANAAARVFLDSAEGLAGQQVEHVLHRQAISVRVTTLRHQAQIVRLYALRHPSEDPLITEH